MNGFELNKDDPVSWLLQDPDILEGAWRRVRAWYKGGEWAPQPEFAAWELDPEAHLRHLGRVLARGRYRPQPMPLLPYAKKKGRLRHFCQPTVRDQVAFMIFGVLLAPIFELGMENCSFGNRWYRGLVRAESSIEGRPKFWTFRQWTLAEDRIYQPYRRAHGLFRRVASWTVDAMLNCPISTGTPTGARVLPRDYALEMIPEFVRPAYWEKLPRSYQVYWARFDLKLAFPSMQIDTLREAARSLVTEVLDGTLKFPFVRESLALYPQAARALLESPDIRRQLIDYLCVCLGNVRYEPFENSDARFFPPDEDNPPLLPRGDGEGHPGLPTGLALSPILLNVYLHCVDRAMHDWAHAGNKAKPAAFLRFADDMILLANDKDLLVQGIEVLMNVLASPRNSERDLNLRMNWGKSKPDNISKALNEFRKIAFDPDNPQDWQSARANLQAAVAKNGITKDSRDPFVTDLVERFSELGMERETDALPENARLRLTRLQEIVVFRPNDEAVPRETQLSFTANKLVRTWLPEEDEQQDADLLIDIRRSVGEALRGALDKPRLWRAVLRAALRRPIPHGKPDSKIIKADVDHATAWLSDLLQQFSRKGDGFWARTEEPKAPDDWQQFWPLFASFHRTAFWRTIAETVKEMAVHVAAQSSEQAELPEPESWFYRSFDESTLPEAFRWLEKQIHSAMEIFYLGETSFEPLPNWEASALGLAMLSVVPRNAIAEHFHENIVHERRFNAVVAGLAVAHDEKLRVGANLLSQSQSLSRRRADYRRLLWLARADDSGKGKTYGRLLADINRPSTVVRLAAHFGYDALPIAKLMQSAQREVESHNMRFRSARKAKGGSARAELSRYHRARRILLGLGSTTL